MKLAAAAYPLDWLDDWAAYAAKLSTWVAEAAGHGADLLVFPEYGAMELASLAGAEAAGDLAGCIDAVDARLAEADALHADLARRHRVHVLAASAPARMPEGPVNRARFFAPSGAMGHQDKQIMTRFERDDWGIRPGGPLCVFDTAIGKIGVLVCYDAEFPLLGRALAEAGAELILVPSCTEAEAGYSRVRIGARARALENQCVTVQAVTVGPAPWCPAVDANTGAAGLYGPPDLGFPPTGVLAQGGRDRPGWTYATLDPDAIGRVRRDGQVLNHAHWPEQIGRCAPVETCGLR